MTKKSNKEIHRDIIEKNASPHTEQSKKDTEEMIYGDENNPYEKFSTGDRDLDLKKEEE